AVKAVLAKAKKAMSKKAVAVKKAKPAPAKKAAAKPALKPVAKKTAKPGVKKAPPPKAKKPAPKPIAKVSKPVPKAAKSAPETAAKPSPKPIKQPAKAAKPALAPATKAPAPAPKAIKKATPAPAPAPAVAPAAEAALTKPVAPQPTASAAAAATPKTDSKPAATSKAAAPTKPVTPSPAILPKPLFADRPRSALGVAALPPGGMPEWWRWHQDYPGEETLRRGTVLTSFNVYAGLYTDTLRIHMAAGQSGIRAVSYSSKFSIDGDGSGGKQKGDVDYSDNTSLHLNDGNPPSKKNALNSLTYPFAVLPLPPKSGSTLHFQALGLDVGDIGIAFFGRGLAAPFMYGDEGPALQVGEGSVQMAKDLGMDWEPRMNTSPATGGFNEKEMRDYAPGVLHIAFPGSRDRPDRITDILTRETLQTKAWELFKRWKQSLRGGVL
ncbi:MAG: secreted protein, partial [Verrucomicrobiaceae bacterium]|nr:secreted protein [Verrucomicrobiaceae bacterium]